MPPESDIYKFDIIMSIFLSILVCFIINSLYVSPTTITIIKDY